jgi:uncharacterized protein YndB with AHSA1/START domain
MRISLSVVSALVQTPPIRRTDRAGRALAQQKEQPMSNDLSSAQDVLVTRIFDAPRDQVFRAWIEPDEVAVWYGPAHMEIARDSVRIDARVSGRWEVTMVPRAGGDGFTIGYEILELVEPELLVMRSDPMPGQPDGTVVRVELHDHGARRAWSSATHPSPL